MSNVLELEAKVIDKRYGPNYRLRASKIGGSWGIGIVNEKDHVIQHIPSKDLTILSELIFRCNQYTDEDEHQEKQNRAKDLKKQGMSIRQIMTIMGFKNPGSVTHLLKSKP